VKHPSLTTKAFPALLAASFLLALSLPGTALAQAAPDGAALCRSQINAFLKRESAVFDARLFGTKRAADEPEGATRTAFDGTLYLKTEEDTWASSGATMSNADMDGATAYDLLPAPGTGSPAVPFPGILETRKALTSDLLPHLTQSFRAFLCRVESVCKAAELALMKRADGNSATVKVTVPGCREMELPVLNRCVPNPVTFILNDQATLPHYCGPVAEDLILFQESKLLFLAHEDASHRTLRQFAGYLEPFLNIVRFPFVQPFRQVTSFVGQWSGISCFLSHCAQEE
jgi:hypothetical protein